MLTSSHVAAVRDSSPPRVSHRARRIFRRLENSQLRWKHGADFLLFFHARGRRNGAGGDFDPRILNVCY